MQYTSHFADIKSRTRDTKFFFNPSDNKEQQVNTVGTSSKVGKKKLK